MSNEPVKVALLGAGNVGAQVVRLLHEQAADLTARIGAPLELVGVAVRRLGLQRDGLPIDPSLLTTDPLGLGKRAEADPTADIEGFDAAAKAAILASLAFHTRVRAADVYREGITEVTAADMASAKAMGATIKLLCIAARTGDAVSVRVHPAMIPRT